MILERECDWLPARPGPIGRQLVPADRAEPGKERRFTAPRVDLPHGYDQRRLDDFLGGVFVAKSPHGEAEQAWKVRTEKLIKRALVARSHALNELNVVHTRNGCRCSLPPVLSTGGLPAVGGASGPESFGIG